MKDAFESMKHSEMLLRLFVDIPRIMLTPVLLVLFVRLDRDRLVARERGERDAQMFHFFNHFARTLMCLVDTVDANPMG